jgi:hypothetical protein
MPLPLFFAVNAKAQPDGTDRLEREVVGPFISFILV